MRAKLYKNMSDPRTVNKSIVLIKEYSVNLLGECPVTDPVITLTAPAPLAGNYIYIDAFKRYYYITKATIQRNNLWSLECHVDVLMSHDISSCRGLVVKSENTYNLMIDDKSLMASNKPKIVYKNFPSGLTSESFILAVAGGSAS